MGTKVIFIFLDGVGLGIDDPDINPFVRANLPNITNILDGKLLLQQSTPYIGHNASLFTIDACLGVSGLPQSATGQATLLTGVNVPATLGYHYGPKPNHEVAEHLKNGNLFSKLSSCGLKSALINAYPPRYFDAIRSGRRIHSAIPLAVTAADIPLYTIDDLITGNALAADFTGQGWREHLGIENIPILSPEQAGTRIASIARDLDLTFFEYWLSDLAGHRQDMIYACLLLENLDRVLGALISSWEDGLIFLTSDHGNIEDLSTRRHTHNPVPVILIGPQKVCIRLNGKLKSLADITPAIVDLMTGN